MLSVDVVIEIASYARGGPEDDLVAVPLKSVGRISANCLVLPPVGSERGEVAIPVIDTARGLYRLGAGN